VFLCVGLFCVSVCRFLLCLLCACNHFVTRCFARVTISCTRACQVCCMSNNIVQKSVSITLYVLRRSQDRFLRQKIERFFSRDFSGEEFREKHYCPYNFVPINWLWSGFIFPELEHL